MAFLMWMRVRDCRSGEMFWAQRDFDEDTITVIRKHDVNGRSTPDWFHTITAKFANKYEIIDAHDREGYEQYGWCLLGWDEIPI